MNTYSYDPYGNATTNETVPNPFRFTGAIWDSQTGLYKMGERFYDPTIGRFTQPDPNDGGYTYCDDNPVNFVDPEGLKKHKKPKKKTKHHTAKHKSGSCGLFCSIGSAVSSAARKVGGALTGAAKVADACIVAAGDTIAGTVLGSAALGGLAAYVIFSEPGKEGPGSRALGVAAIPLGTAAGAEAGIMASVFSAPVGCFIGGLRQLAAEV